jgi:multicomponent Na+:H+ antiporter subunit E
MMVSVKYAAVQTSCAPLGSVANSDRQPSLIGSMLINTTPGSVALDVSPDRKLLYVHVMYMSTPDAARDEIKTGFERRVLGVLG